MSIKGIIVFKLNACASYPVICNPTLANHIKSCVNLAAPIPILLDPGVNFTAWHPDDCQVELLPGLNPIQVVQSGGHLMESSSEAMMASELLPPSFPQEIFNRDVLPTLKNQSIISLGKLYNAGCEVLLTRQKAVVLHNNRDILGSIRNQDPVKSMQHHLLRLTRRS